MEVIEIICNFAVGNSIAYRFCALCLHLLWHMKKPYHKHDVVIGRIFAFVCVLLMEVIIYVECRCFFFERNLLFSRTEGLSGYDYELKTKNEKYKFSNYLCPILTNRAKISDQSINVNEYRVSFLF